ncbi:hypothetical protein QJS10_CPA09g01790 [Acorus calamus]|uniref:Uncharacterized protein n=1 Tax=Acorus calamus TaxID=4465 RepID=A0AAV9E2S3_ACOCL|nr:hypothetical protein QJS10_CPA09g01790 [Acorus calamus]
MQQRNMGFPSQAITIGILIGLLVLSSSSHVDDIRGDARLLLPKLSSGGGLGLGEEKRSSTIGMGVSPPQPAGPVTGSCLNCPPHPPPPPAPSLQVPIVAAPPPPVD